MPPSMSPDYDRKTPFAAAEKVSSRLVDNPRPVDVLSSFIALPESGRKSKITCDGQISGFRYMEVTPLNHFQGIQRVAASNYLFVSGAEPGVKGGQFSVSPASHVFLAQMGTRPALGPWRGGPKDSRDTIIKTFVPDNQKWHAGGISLLGHILAVPIYGQDNQTGRHDSEILFLDVSFPEIPKLFPKSILRPGVLSGAVALARLPNNHFICAVWSDSDKSIKPRFDFYVSNTTDFFDGFRDGIEVTTFRTEVKDVVEGKARQAKYQSLNFVTQEYQSADDYHVYLIGMDRASRDTAELLLVEFPPETLNPNPILATPTITLLDRQRFKCDDVHGHFKAANGVFVDHDGSLYLYSAGYWRIDDCIGFVEFAA